MQMPATVLAFSISPYRPEERALKVLTVPCQCQVVFDALCCLWIDCQTPLLATLAHHAQRIKPTIDVEVPDLQAGDLRPAEPDLQSDRQNGAVTQPQHRVRVWSIQNRPR